MLTIFVKYTVNFHPICLRICFRKRQNCSPRARGRGTGGGGNGGLCPPTFFKREKSALFSGLKCPIQRTKKYFLNKRPLFLERKCPFRSSKDSVKAISDVTETPYFKNFSFGSWTSYHKIVWFWSYTKVPLLVNAPLLSKCFRGLCLELQKWNNFLGRTPKQTPVFSRNLIWKCKLITNSFIIIITL
jgi:hypothetical protein